MLRFCTAPLCNTALTVNVFEGGQKRCLIGHRNMRIFLNLCNISVSPAVYRAERQEQPFKFQEQKGNYDMKKVIVYVLSALMVLSMAACGAPANQSENVQIPSPFTDCDTLQDAASVAGFEVILPASIAGYAQDRIQVIDKNMIQVFYVDDAENVILIRKAVGSEDISGDYNTYTQEETTAVGNTDVLMKGNDGLIDLAVWTSGEYTYSVSVHNGITSASMADLIAEIQ